MPPIANKTQLTLDAATAELAKETQRADALVIEIEAFKKAVTEQTARADAAEGALAVSREKIQELEAGRVDQAALDTQIALVKDLNTQLAAEKKARLDAEDPIRRSAEVRQRARIEAAVHSVIGTEFKCDALSDRELMIEVVKKLGKAPEATESDASIRARFDERVANFDASEAAIARVRLASNGLQREQQQRQDTAADVKARTEADRRNAWQKPSAYTAEPATK